MHSGRFSVVAGRPLDEGLLQENLDAIKEGSKNLVKQIENARDFGVPVVVAVNVFPTDTDKEVEVVKKVAIGAGAENAVVSEAFTKGGAGAADLAKAVAKAASRPSNFKFLYPLDMSIKEKIERVATRMYGAREVEYEKLAEKQIKVLTDNGFDKLPVCMAKTHLSLSHDPKVKGRPRDFKFPVREVRVSAGAGFLYALCGDMMTMPGLPSVPGGTKVDIDSEGNVVGMF